MANDPAHGIPTFFDDPLACWLLGLHYRQIRDPKSYTCPASGITGKEIVDNQQHVANRLRKGGDFDDSDLEILAASDPTQVLKVYDHLPDCSPCTWLQQAYLCSVVSNYDLPASSITELIRRPIRTPAEAVLFINTLMSLHPGYENFEGFYRCREDLNLRDG